MAFKFEDSAYVVSLKSHGFALQIEVDTLNLNSFMKYETISDIFRMPNFVK